MNIGITKTGLYCTHTHLLTSQVAGNTSTASSSQVGVKRKARKSAKTRRCLFSTVKHFNLRKKVIRTIALCLLDVHCT